MASRQGQLVSRAAAAGDLRPAGVPARESAPDVDAGPAAEDPLTVAEPSGMGDPPAMEDSPAMESLPGDDELAEAEAAAAERAAEQSRRGGAAPRVRQGGRFRHEVLAAVFQVRDKRLHVLMWQRAQAPFEGCWALPGGRLGADERLGTSLGRHLAAKVDLTDVAHLEQLETRSDPNRDPREREVATAYLVLVSTDADPALPADTAWQPVESLPPSAFDHASIIQSGRERLRAKLTYTNAGFALAPATFTIAELRDIYAACIGHPVAATNLQRVLTRRGVIEPTQATVQRGIAGGRPAALYRFASSSLVVTDPFAVFRPPATGEAAL